MFLSNSFVQLVENYMKLQYRRCLNEDGLVSSKSDFDVNLFKFCKVFCQFESQLGKDSLLISHGVLSLLCGAGRRVAIGQMQ